MNSIKFCSEVFGLERVKVKKVSVHLRFQKAGLIHTRKSKQIGIWRKGKRENTGANGKHHSTSDSIGSNDGEPLQLWTFENGNQDP